MTDHENLLSFASTRVGMYIAGTENGTHYYIPSDKGQAVAEAKLGKVQPGSTHTDELNIPKKAPFKKKEIAAVGKAPRQRKQELRNDPVYVRSLEGLTLKLEEQWGRHGPVLEEFFKKFRFPDVRNNQEIKRYIRQQPQKTLRSVLNDYVAFYIRFKVGLRFLYRRGSLRVQEDILPFSTGSTFHAKIIKGDLKPVIPVPNNENYGIPYEDLFESNDVEIPNIVRSLVEKGTAKFFQIDDKRSDSVLSDLERIAYHSRGITFIVHNSDQPYLFCLFGENLSKRAVREIEKVVTEHQQAHYPGRGKRGRRPKIARIRETASALKGSGRMKEKAQELKDLPNIASAQSTLSRAKKSLLNTRYLKP